MTGSEVGFLGAAGFGGLGCKIVPRGTILGKGGARIVPRGTIPSWRGLKFGPGRSLAGSTDLEPVHGANNLRLLLLIQLGGGWLVLGLLGQGQDAAFAPR